LVFIPIIFTVFSVFYKKCPSARCVTAAIWYAIIPTLLVCKSDGNLLILQVKGKFNSVRCNEGREGEQRHNSTLSLTSAVEGGWVVHAMLQPLHPRE
jgi:hypothetical protein